MNKKHTFGILDNHRDVKMDISDGNKSRQVDFYSKDNVKRSGRVRCKSD